MESKIDKMLIIDEGYRAKPYIDSEGYPTGGIGIRLGPKGASLGMYQFTIPLNVAKLWALTHAQDMEARLSSSSALQGVWGGLEQARKDALINMAFQLGFDGLMNFKKMLAAVRAGNWQEATRQGKDSKWYGQTKDRATRVLATLERADYSAYSGLSSWVN